MFAASSSGLAGLSLARFLGLFGLSAFSSHSGSGVFISSFLAVNGAAALSLSVHRHLILNLEKKYKRCGKLNNIHKFLNTDFCKVL